jgi:hypothetical protein
MVARLLGTNDPVALAKLNGDPISSIGSMNRIRGVVVG